MPEPKAYKRPESVLVVVASRDGKVLMLERVSPTGFWQSVTGSLQQNETAVDAARRELAEETGLVDVEIRDCHQVNDYPILPAWRHRYAPGVQGNREYVFCVTLETTADVMLNPAEHTAQLWLPREEAAAKAFSHTNRDAILAFVPA